MNSNRIRLALGAAAIGLGAAAAQSAMAQSVSIDIRPGVYGRVNIGQPLPPVAYVNAQPVIVQQAPVAIQRQPIYLYVPPAHSANWARYCGRYNACAQPVVFVQDRWVRDRYQQAHYDPRGPRGPRHDRDHDGVRNRYDRDRDGDGVRNSHDRRPNDPRRN